MIFVRKPFEQNLFYSDEDKGDLNTALEIYVLTTSENRIRRRRLHGAGGAPCKLRQSKLVGRM